MMGGKSIRTNPAVLTQHDRDATRARAHEHLAHGGGTARDDGETTIDRSKLPTDRSLTPPSIVLFVDDSDESAAAFATLEQAELRFAAKPSPNGHAPYVEWMGTEIVGPAQIATFASNERAAKSRRREILDQTLPPAMRNVSAEQQERAGRIKERERQEARRVLEATRSAKS